MNAWNEFDGAMQEAASALLRAAQGLHDAILAERASKKVREEQEDLRERVARLQALVIELSRKIDALRKKEGD